MNDGFVNVVKNEYPQWVYQEIPHKSCGRIFMGVSSNRIKHRMMMFDILGDVGFTKADQIVEYFKDEYGHQTPWNSISLKRRKNLYVQKKAKCCYCQKVIAFAEMTIEHLVPRALGGEDDESNFDIACVACNQEKSRELSDCINEINALRPTATDLLWQRGEN